MNKDSLNKIVTGIIEEIEEGGVLPWRKNFSLPNLGVPVSYTGRPYRGMNRLTLMIASLKHGDNRWIGFHQIKSLGGHLRRASKGCPICLPLFRRDKVDIGDQSEEGEGDLRLSGFKLAYVFNMADTINIPSSKIVPLPSPNPSFDPIQAAEDFIAIRNPTIQTGMAPAYSPQADTIYMPPRAAYPKAALFFYNDLLHEIGHWTGHSSRLNRLEPAKFGTDPYAREELVAELFSLFSMASCGLESGESGYREPSISYLKGWIEKLRTEPSVLLKAASEAQRALDWYLGDKGANIEAPTEDLEPAQAA